MTVERSPLGLYRVTLDVFPDERGSFRESWQREKMLAAGLPDFQPVQANVSVNKKGVIRGIHAEPWDKYIHVSHGAVYAVLLDLRADSPTFGEYESYELNETNALLVPEGFGNSFQALTEPAVYSYLVTKHWRTGLTYPAVAFDDPDLAIPWPLPREEWIISEKDQHNPTLRAAFPEQFTS